MRRRILVIGYRESEQEAVGAEWRSYGIEFDFVDVLPQAIEKLVVGEYICVAICSGHVPHQDVEALRRVRGIPVVVLPPEYSTAQRFECVQYGATQYIHSLRRQAITDLGARDNMRRCLDLSSKERKPLTLITARDLSFCLEYRTVEVRGQQIDLTAKEFEILALLITHQKRVFTYEMIMDLVWHEDYSYYSRKAINNHISNLRKKLKIAPDVPEYIKSVHSVGYKFEA